MDNHPIPQDITGFQFKLIGNMTVKQFIYLATGTVLAWFIFFILPLHFLIRFPLAVIFLGGGIALAFLPIEGRPMDTMISNLIRALFAPTQYIYKKEGGNLAASNAAAAASDAADAATASNPSTGSGQAADAQTPATTEAQSSPLNIQNQTSVSSVDSSVNSVSAMSTPLPQPIEPINPPPPSPPSILSLDEEPQAPQSEFEKMLAETIRQKEALEKELLALKAKLENQQEKPVLQADTPPKPTQKPKKAQDVQDMPQDPNLIVGAVKDPRGNPLPNILVEVKDAEDNPVRAFKTNSLGKFASATSLSNGKYVVTLEDPAGANKFDAVQIEATGTPIMPLEIFSVDPREELRRELFT